MRWPHDMTMTLPQPPTDRHQRQWIWTVYVCIAHPAAIEDQRVIEQRPVAVWRSAQLLGTLREHSKVPGVEDRVLHLHVRLLAMVRDRVMRLGDADIRIALHAGLAGHHEREHASEVGLVGHREEIEKLADMLGVFLRHADRRIGYGHVGRVLRLGALNPPLDLPDVVEIATELGAVARTKIAFEVVEIV